MGQLLTLRTSLAAAVVSALLTLAIATPASAAAPPGRPDALKLLSDLARTRDLAYANVVGSADFVAAKEQAGLSADTDLFKTAQSFSEQEVLPGTLTREFFGFVAGIYRHPAELTAFDGSKITAAAGTSPFFGEPGTLVIATTQDRGDLQRRLVKAGLRKRGQVLEGNGSGKPAYFPFIVVGRGGLVVLTDQSDVARDALRPPRANRFPPPVNAASVAAELDSHAAYLGVVAHSRGCVRSAIATQDITDLAGEITLNGSIPKRNVDLVPHYFTDAYDPINVASHGRQVTVTFSRKRPYEQGMPIFGSLLDKGSAIRFHC